MESTAMLAPHSLARAEIRGGISVDYEAELPHFVHHELDNLEPE